MSKEEVSLRLEMDKLEIEPTSKLNKNIKEENPFVHQTHSRRPLPKKSLLHCKCSCCISEKKDKSIAIIKKKPNKLLKEPVLKLLQTCNNNIVSEDEIRCKQQQSKNISQKGAQSLNSEMLSLCALVDNCNQLRISSGCHQQLVVTERNEQNKWWKNTVTAARQNKESTVEKSATGTGSCSQQALNPPCDVTIDELASYFETLVHIPKKMSSMAEMMYI